MRIVDTSGDQAKRAAAGIGADIEDAASRVGWGAGVVVDVIFVVVFARGDQAKVGIGLVGGEEAHLAGGVAGNGEEQEATAAGAFDVEAKALVGFFVEQRIGPAATHDVAIEAVGALGGFVFDSVEERAVVGRPGGTGDGLDANGQRLASAQIFVLQRVLPEAGSVEGIGEDEIVGAARQIAKAGIKMAVREPA